MLTLKEIHADILDVTEKVISVGLSNRENYPSVENLGNGFSQLGISGVSDLAVALKKVPYRDLYTALEHAKFYNFILADGGIIQMIYVFKNDTILKHKLAYFPSPDFEAFQSESELYMDDCVYVEILDKRIIPVAVRFDYDCTPGTFKDLEHPKSHLTLGQYENCRIPVCSPVTPSLFIEFILRSFYNTALLNFSDKINLKLKRFQETATMLERNRIHIRVK